MLQIAFDLQSSPFIYFCAITNVNMFILVLSEVTHLLILQKKFFVCFWMDFYSYGGKLSKYNISLSVVDFMYSTLQTSGHYQRILSHRSFINTLKITHIVGSLSLTVRHEIIRYKCLLFY